MMQTKLTPWQDVDLYWLDGGRRLNDEEKRKALTEYRRSGGMYLVSMVDPETHTEDEIVNDGPKVDEIDWAGFDLPPCTCAPGSHDCARARAIVG